MRLAIAAPHAPDWGVLPAIYDASGRRVSSRHLMCARPELLRASQLQLRQMPGPYSEAVLRTFLGLFSSILGYFSPISSPRPGLCRPHTQAKTRKHCGNRARAAADGSGFTWPRRAQRPLRSRLDAFTGGCHLYKPSKEDLVLVALPSRRGAGSDWPAPRAETPVLQERRPEMG